MRMSTMRAVCLMGAMVLGSALFAGGRQEGEASATRRKVRVYTALEADQLQPYKTAIEAALQDIEIEWLRDSTGVITARLIAEKDNPQADLLFTLPVSSIEVLKSMGMIEAYTPAGIENLKPLFSDTQKPIFWTGTDVYLTTVVANIPELQKLNAPVPRSWKDLLNPKYAGRIVMPNPNSSATGYITIAAWIALWGEEAAWSYMDNLHKNIAVYLHSGSRPVASTAQGEYAIGIGSDLRAVRELTQGAPIEIVVPTEGTGWDMSAVAIMANRPAEQQAAARKIADWSTSLDSHKIGAQFFGVVGNKGINTVPVNYPPALEKGMIPNIDMRWLAKNRERILLEWTRRYDVKSAPKS